ncbi:MAG: hypothetical protein ACRCXK_12445 [Wohlfahrtiimonas sp.]
MTSKRTYIYVLITLAIIGYKFFYYDRREPIPAECIEYDAYHKEAQIKIDNKKSDSIAEVFHSTYTLDNEAKNVAQAIKHLRKQPDKLKLVCIQAMDNIKKVMP